MATYYSQGSGAWSTLSNWDTNAGGGGSDPASIAAMEDNLFVIQAGHTIDYDLTDPATWTTGFQTITIQGHATTPGMLRCDSTTEADGTYILPMKTGFSIAGTTGTEKGRILCNSDGDWTHSVDCDNAVKFIIKTLAGSSAVATIDATYLTIRLFCVNPANDYVEIYGCPFVVTFDNTTEKFTIVSPTNTPAIPPNGTPIKLSGTLPAELTAGITYFVKAVSGATGELEATIGGGTIALSDNGSGTIYMHYGCWGPVAQATEVNTTTGVITWNGVPPVANTVVRVKSSGTLPTGLNQYDVYYTRTISGNTCKLSTTNSDAGIVIPTAVGSGNLSMYCGSTYTNSKVVNVVQDVTGDIWSTTTGFNRVALVSYGPTSYDQQRDLLATIATRYMVLTNLNIDSTQNPLARLYYATRNVSLQSLSTGASQTLVAVSIGGIFKCEFANLYQPGTVTTWYSYGITGGNNTISGIMYGLNYPCRALYNSTISAIFCCGLVAVGGACMGTVFSGTIIGYSTGVDSGRKLIIGGLVIGCSTMVTDTTDNIVTGILCGGTYGFSNGSVANMTGSMYSITNHFRAFPAVSAILKNANTPTALTFYDRNTTNLKMRIACENLARVDGSYKIFEMFGDIIKTACDGTGDAPSEDPDGGHDYCIEASNLQSNLGIPAGSIYPNVLPIIERDKHRIWLSAASHTITYKVQTTFAGISAGNLILTCSYQDAAGALVEATNAPAIAQRSDAADWTQVLAVTIVPGRAGWVNFRIDLQEYESGKEVYVWPNPTVS